MLAIKAQARVDRAAEDEARRIRDEVLGPHIYKEGSGRPPAPQLLWRRSGALAGSIRAEAMETDGPVFKARVYSDADILRRLSGRSHNYASDLNRRFGFLRRGGK